MMEQHYLWGLLYPARGKIHFPLLLESQGVDPRCMPRLLHTHMQNDGCRILKDND